VSMSFNDLLESDLDDVFFGEEGPAVAVTLNGEETMAIVELGTGKTKEINQEQRHVESQISIKNSELLRITGRTRFQSSDVIIHDGIEWQFNSLTSGDSHVQRVRCISEESGIRLR